MFRTSISAQYVRIYPYSCYSHCSMRSAVLAVREAEKDDGDARSSFCMTDLHSKFLFNTGFSLSGTGVAVVGQYQGSEGGSFDNNRAVWAQLHS